MRKKDNLYSDDPTYWHPGFRCVYGHKDCATDMEDGLCSGQQVLWDEREFSVPTTDELEAIINSVRSEIAEKKAEKGELE